MTHRKLDIDAGFSLIEVMVAAAVLGIGLAGLAALLFSSIIGTSSSLSRSSAALHAESMAELVRINPLGSATLDNAVPGAAPVCDTTNSCSPAEFTQHSVWHWKNRVLTDLPDGTADICVVGESIESPLGLRYCPQSAAVVRWTDGADGGSSKPENQVFSGLPF